MSDPRDKYSKKTPPKGVADQIAGKASSLTYRDSRVQPGDWTDGPQTDTIDNPIDRIDARTQRMARVSESVPSAVESVRRELHGEISEVKGDVKTVMGHVSELRETVGGISGQLKILPDLVELAKMRRQEDHVTFTAQVDVNKHQQIATIDDESDKLRKNRELRNKILAAISTIAAGAMTAYHFSGC